MAACAAVEGRRWRPSSEQYGLNDFAATSTDRRQRRFRLQLRLVVAESALSLPPPRHSASRHHPVIAATMAGADHAILASPSSTAVFPAPHHAAAILIRWTRRISRHVLPQYGGAPRSQGEFDLVRQHAGRSFDATFKVSFIEYSRSADTHRIGLRLTEPVIMPRGSPRQRTLAIAYHTPTGEIEAAIVLAAARLMAAGDIYVWAATCRTGRPSSETSLDILPVRDAPTGARGIEHVSSDLKVRRRTTTVPSRDDPPGGRPRRACPARGPHAAATSIRPPDPAPAQPCQRADGSSTEDPSSTKPRRADLDFSRRRPRPPNTANRHYRQDGRPAHYACIYILSVPSSPAHPLIVLVVDARDHRHRHRPGEISR